MLEYDFSRVIKARGIEKPFRFLRNNGFSSNFASKIKNNKIRRLEVAQLEKLCMLFRCTPDDMMVWTPEGDDRGDKKHPLNKIRRTDLGIDMLKTINSIPLQKLGRIEQLIKEELDK